MAEQNSEEYVESGETHTGLRQAMRGTGENGLDLICTKLAVDFQCLDAERLAERFSAGLQSLTDASGADSVFIAVFDLSRRSIETVYAGHSAFAVSNPEVLTGRDLASFPWLAKKLGHLALIDIADTAEPGERNATDAQELARLHIAALTAVGFNIGAQVGGMLGVASAAPHPQWSADFLLALKLISVSCSSGLERIRLHEELAMLQERDRLVTETGNDGLWDYDVRHNSMYFSPRWRTMLGYSSDEDVPDWRYLVHPDDIARVQRQLRDHLEGKTPLFESIHRMRHANGDWRWIECRVQGRVDEHGRAIRLVGIETDITERRLYEEALFREKESAQITLQSIGDGVVTTDTESNVQYLNPVAVGLTGWELDDAVGHPIDEIFRGFHEETCEPVENPVTIAMRRNRRTKTVRPTLLIRRDGNELYIESTAAPIRDPNGNVTGGVLVFHDVSESRELNRRLSYAASHDVLTELVNRSEFENRLKRALNSARAEETSYALLYLDLDQFKIVNDACGHNAGDQLLQQLGALLKSKIRWRDTLARLGGDEFGVLLEGCTVEEAVRTAETLRELVADFRFVWEERTFRLGVSIGVVPIMPNTDDVASLMTAADSACAAAKDAGRNRIYCYEENDIDLMKRRKEMQWAARITNALEENRFEMYRQTIQPLHQGLEQGAHYELLLRMRDEQGQIVSPELFINSAERYGLTPQIDRWVITNVFRWLVSEADERERLALCSINLSGRSLADEKFLPFVIEQFKTSGLNGALICFEITETAAIASYSQANRFIHALKELGCRFALDDFGTGLSSFGYLKHFPVDFLKIDGSFVREIIHDPIDREMVRSINEIGHLTGKRTIAEFAENEEIITMLRGIGVDYAQGYGVDRPQELFKATDYPDVSSSVE
ncbi:MAG: EAL domain-containing protein [Gammaproteobacteria bacterium]|jgi:diguanylate cyclase (GGDEF)-like protein/PAS domain S-box-containing protein